MECEKVQVHQSVPYHGPVTPYHEMVIHSLNHWPRWDTKCSRDLLQKSRDPKIMTDILIMVWFTRKSSVHRDCKGLAMITKSMGKQVNFLSSIYKYGYTFNDVSSFFILQLTEKNYSFLWCIKILTSFGTYYTTRITNTQTHTHPPLTLIYSYQRKCSVGVKHTKFLKNVF